MSCSKFTNESKISTNPIDSCGICIHNPNCNLPIKRSPNNNGRTEYFPPKIDIQYNAGVESTHHKPRPSIKIVK